MRTHFSGNCRFFYTGLTVKTRFFDTGSTVGQGGRAQKGSPATYPPTLKLDHSRKAGEVAGFAGWLTNDTRRNENDTKKDFKRDVARCRGGIAFITWLPMLKVRLPDGTLKEYESSLSIANVAADIGPGLAKAALAGEVDGTVVGLDYQLPDSETIDLKILTKKDPDSLNVMRHSCAHVMARAVMRKFKGVQLAFGPTIEGGFYYDFDLNIL